MLHSDVYNSRTYLFIDNAFVHVVHKKHRKHTKYFLKYKKCKNMQ